MKGYKTIIFAVVIAVIGALEAFDWTNIISGDSAGFIIMGIGVLMGWLRKVTTTALGDTE